ncbi:MAG: hydrogenase formation protein HypD [Spirochaetaceae bacterium]|nr:MAG: hydrogenase formation protein HypD [Spirochaetaceae bacterium]
MSSVLHQALHDRRLAKPLLEDINKTAADISRTVRIMEVCGTHTVAIRRSGVHSLLPKNVLLVSGPGCPVCVTPTSYIDNALHLLDHGKATIASFGDMLKVPGSDGRNLAGYLGSGRVRIVYSPTQLLPMARDSSEAVVFLAIGFETTIPTVAAAFLQARHTALSNLFLYTAFKTVPPALRALLDSPERNLDGFLLPGHVSVILGEEPYGFLVQPGGVPGVITGFEPLDLLQGILAVLRQIARGECRVENAYTRAVRPGGNPKAREIMDRVLETSDTLWRGLGRIPDSGLVLRRGFRDADAELRFSLPALENVEPPGCSCARVLQGRVLPSECTLFGERCTPETPVGPCMVSSEGTCAASFRYGDAPL